jgi:hypothetical protein
MGSLRRAVWSSLALGLGVCACLPAVPAFARGRPVFALGVHRHRVPSARKGKPLPAQLVIPPGRYLVGGRAYDLRRSGYYRFGALQRVVFRHSVDRLLSGLAWATDHHVGAAGTPTDDGGSAAALAALAATRKVHLSCGYVSNLAVYLLGQHGIPARRVAMLTKHAFTGNNGHTLIEVKEGGRWVLYDLDYNMQPQSRRGHALTIVQYVSQRRPRVRRIAGDRPRLHALPASYRYVMGTPLVEDGGLWFFGDTSDRQRAAAYSRLYRWIPPGVFMRRFYP